MLERARLPPDELTIEDLTTIIESSCFAGGQLAWALNQRGFRHYLNGEQAEAIECYSRVIAAQPDNLAAYRSRGSARRMLGLVEEALSDHVTCITADPRIVQATKSALIRLGFEPGPVDGNLDEQARGALQQWLAAGCP